MTTKTWIFHAFLHTVEYALNYAKQTYIRIALESSFIFPHFPFCHVIVITIQGKENHIDEINIKFWVRQQHSAMKNVVETGKKWQKWTKLHKCACKHEHKPQLMNKHSSHITFNYNTNHLPCTRSFFCSSCINLKYHIRLCRFVCVSAWYN